MKKNKFGVFKIILLAAIAFNLSILAGRSHAEKPSILKDNFFTRFWYGPKQVECAPNNANAINAASIVLNKNYRTYKILLDPGHGGMPEKPGLTTGDHWDLKAKKFLTMYNFGAYHKNEYEHKIVLDICQRAFSMLRSANTNEGWREFSKLLSSYGVLKPEDYRRINFDIKITRDASFEDSRYTGESNINKHFRLFDSPESFDSKKRASKKMYPGRMSKINSESPELVICVHVNSSDNPEARGQASVIIPGYRVFDFIGQLKSKLGIKSSLAYFWVISCFYPREHIFSNFSKLISDTDTYFTGKRANKKTEIGKRWQMVQWRYSKDDEYDNLLNYKDPDSYWKRERSDNESMRRDGGTAEFGGDNYYASEEVIKFIRFGLWNDYICNQAKNIADTSNIKPPNEYLGNHGDAFVSDWALPQLVNAVTAYIELGYLENDQDRKILTEKKDIIAKSIAVSIYSLLCGFEIKKIPASKDALINCNPVSKSLKNIKAEAPRTTLQTNPLQQKMQKIVRELKNEMKGGGAAKTSKNSIEPISLIAIDSTLKLPFGRRIDFDKYGDYFQSVLKK